MKETAKRGRQKEADSGSRPKKWTNTQANQQRKTMRVMARNRHIDKRADRQAHTEASMNRARDRQTEIQKQRRADLQQTEPYEGFVCWLVA